jgi:hypothetical protein
MYKLVLVAIAVANSIVFLLSTVFAITGGGGPQTGVWTILILGGLSVAIFSLWGLKECARGRKVLGISIAFVPVPFAILVLLVAAPLLDFYAEIKPLPTSVKEHCETAGQKFNSDPSPPLKSFFYDWTTRDDRARPLSIRNAAPGQVDELRMLDNILPPTGIEFVERRNNGRYPTPATSTEPFLRKQNGQTWGETSESKAEAKVVYEIQNLEATGGKWVFELHTISVSTRSDRPILSTLKFVTRNSMTGSVICGFTYDKEVNIEEFIYKALGVWKK